MRNSILLLILLCTNGLLAQDINTKKGYAAEGYDVVAYFDGKAVKGSEKFTTTYAGVKYKFSNQKNAQVFTANPKKFIPQYGGFCAYAIAKSSKKVGVNPKSFQIKGGKLYLFYDTVFADTLEKWNEEGPDLLQKKSRLKLGENSNEKELKLHNWLVSLKTLNNTCC